MSSGQRNTLMERMDCFSVCGVHTHSTTHGHRTQSKRALSFLASLTPLGHKQQSKPRCILWLPGWLPLSPSPSPSLSSPLPPSLSKNHRHLPQPKTDISPAPPPSHLGQVVKVEVGLVISASEHGPQQTSHRRLAGGAPVDHGPQQRYVRGRNQSRAGGAFPVSARPTNLEQGKGIAGKGWVK